MTENHQGKIATIFDTTHESRGLSRQRSVNEYAEVDEQRCVVCGVCYPTCPSIAIKSVRRPEEHISEIPDNKTFIINMLKEKTEKRGQ